MFGLKLLSRNEYRELRETLTTYERTLEDVGWLSLSMDSDMGIEQIVSAEGMSKMIKRVKFYYYTNPLAGQWVNLTTHFVFGEGLSKPRAHDRKIQDIIDTFWENFDNKISLTSFQAQQLLCNKLQYEGNLFFMLFDDDKGDVRVRVLNTEEVADIIRAENDRNRTNFYKVSERRRKYNFASDNYEYQQSEFVYYPDCNIFDETEHNINARKLKTGVKIYHVKVNSDINDKFGFPDLYRGIDWQKAHKDMLGDVATLVKALSKFAWKKKVKGSPAKVNALKSALATKTTLSNIANSAGQTQIENEGIDLQAVKIETGGVKIGVDGSRQMLLQNCAASGIMEHYYGDPSTGNLATTKTMELPMLKKFLTYQMLWQGIYNTLLQYQIDRKIEVGLLPGNIIIDKKNRRKIYETDIDRTIDVDFPPILEDDLKAVAEGLEIGKRNKLIGKETAAQIFLNAANVNNIEEEIKKIDFTEPEANPLGAGKGLAKAITSVPVRETIETPDKAQAVKVTKKNNYVLQRMNGYRKSLSGNFRQMQEDIKKSIITAGEKGYVVGNIRDFDVILQSFSKRMKDSAYEYFPVAVEIGKSYLQSHLPKNSLKETLFEAQGRTHGLLQEKLIWNDNYIDTSLVPDIKNKVEESLKDYYDTPQKFSAKIAESVSTFESRIEQYVGAFWRVEEAAVKDAGRGTGLMVNFIGADDSGTCDGCADAMANNPHPIDSAPEPGGHECNGRCFVDPRTKVVTEKGWKRIDAIKVGDKVLGHSGKFKNVYGIINKDNDHLESTYEVNITANLKRWLGWSSDKNKEKRLTQRFLVTGDHEFLNMNKWVMAKNLLSGDRVSIMAKVCKQCGDLFSITKEGLYAEVCSNDCATLYYKKYKAMHNKESCTVIRFKENEVKKEIQVVENQLITTLANHDGDYKLTDGAIISVKKLKTQSKKIYCLKVEGDESFIVNRGIVSHNCRHALQIITNED